MVLFPESIQTTVRGYWGTEYNTTDNAWEHKGFTLVVRDTLFKIDRPEGQPELRQGQPVTLVALCSEHGVPGYAYGVRLEDGTVVYDLKRDEPNKYAFMPEGTDLEKAAEMLYESAGDK